ncbi:MAG: hypothetical protein DI556_22465 [Rhodovulum sulfidophilum]|uniref:HTH araC/xylS-type domain-containing protein n=1 Tax=Rhodovulum sulfidophilum TaxID=35806 RepID=A0A2W5MWA5_RHOSU|nr:MAG: hypothetical protein DI556_22465 [Rhodovulum sulfidophilum]
MKDKPDFVSVLAEVRRTGPGVALQINHVHDEIEFNLVVSGRGTYFLEDGQHDLVPGTLVWLLPGQPHRLIRSPDFDMWVVTAKPDMADPRMMEDVAGRPCRVLSTADAVALDRLLSHLSQDADEPRVYRPGLEYALRSAWHISMNGDGPARGPVHPAVARALAILRSSAETPRSGQLARMCGVTADYLGQLLLRDTGRGLVEWRNRARLERFHRAYPRSRDLLTAALEAGFGSYTQFHRVFQDLVGTTPGQWARSGAWVETVALPSQTAAMTGSDGESTRMIWYALSEAPQPAVSRWIAPAFARSFERAEGAGGAPRCPSGVTDYPDLRRFQGPLVDALDARDAKAAALLARAFAREDVFAAFAQTIGLYPIHPANLCDLMGTFYAATVIGATHAPLMTPAALVALVERTRAALAASGAFAGVDLERRGLAAASLVAHMHFLRGAWGAARASGDDAAALRVAQAARTGAITTLGIDPLTGRAAAAEPAAPRDCPRG